MASSAPTASEYIVHHLAHWNSSGHAQENVVDFSIINYDTILWSTVCAVITGWLLRKAALRVSSGVPGRFTGFIESLVEFVDDQARSIVHGDVRYIAPLALTAFVWIFFMNAIDLIPVDLPPWIMSLIGVNYQRAVPTADLNAPLAMSLVVIASSIYYGIKVKGAGGFTHELFIAPFGAGPSSGPGVIIKPLLWIANFAMQIIEYVARLVSLGMRLFGNMFAGELVFMLIALLGGTAASIWIGTHFVLGLGWAIFHILIITLQAFIFMMLTFVYIGQAHEAH